MLFDVQSIVREYEGAKLLVGTSLDTTESPHNSLTINDDVYPP